MCPLPLGGCPSQGLLPLTALPGAASAGLPGFARFQASLCSSALLAIKRGIRVELPHSRCPAKGASCLGSAGFGDRQNRNVNGRKTGFSGAQLASPDRHPRGPTPLGLGWPSGEGAGIAMGAPFLSRACGVPPGGQLWPPASPRAGDRPGWPKAQRSRAGGHQLPVGGPAWPSLWTQCPGLLHNLAGRQGTVAGRGYGQLADWGWGTAWPEQRASSYNLTHHVGPGEDQPVCERDTGAWCPAEDLSHSSLPRASVSPYHS